MTASSRRGAAHPCARACPRDNLWPLTMRISQTAPCARPVHRWTNSRAWWHVKQQGQRFIYFRSLFMSGCKYSREGMASYGGPIHILFASYDGLPASWTRKRRRCTVGGVHGPPARLLCSGPITGLLQRLSNRSRCNKTSPVSAGNAHPQWLILGFVFQWKGIGVERRFKRLCNVCWDKNQMNCWEQIYILITDRADSRHLTLYWRRRALWHQPSGRRALCLGQSCWVWWCHRVAG